MYHHANAPRREDGEGGDVEGAFKALLELLNEYLQRGIPLTVRSTSLGWKVLTRAEVVTALILTVASSGSDPMQFALHSGRTGDANQLGRKASRNDKLIEQEGGSRGRLWHM